MKKDLIGVNHCMHFCTAFLLASLRMAPHTLKNRVGEQTDGC